MYQIADATNSTPAAAYVIFSYVGLHFAPRIVDIHDEA